MQLQYMQSISPLNLSVGSGNICLLCYKSKSKQFSSQTAKKFNCRFWGNLGSDSLFNALLFCISVRLLPSYRGLCLASGLLGVWSFSRVRNGFINVLLMG
ncbi:hypothetical protein V6N11_059001 [Hibiscus sabdariffa]|uniref:Uncharacterized protein n=1 Tax=Hibiscus sabdariffa TaxID=183260 RepID=A0ABR2U6P5_9ROSI